MTMVGLCVAIFTLPVMIPVIIKDLEPLPSLDQLQPLLLITFVQIMLMFITNFAISITFPLLVAVSITLALPAFCIKFWSATGWSIVSAQIYSFESNWKSEFNNNANNRSGGIILRHHYTVHSA